MQGRRSRWPSPARALSLLLLGSVAALGAAGVGHSVGGIAPAATVTRDFAPVADAHVRSDARSTNYGSLGELWADSSPTTRSYLRFQVTGVDGTVSRALLRVHAKTGHSTGFQVQRVTNTTWSEGSITYSNAPSVSSTVAATSGALTAGAFKTVDITSLVTGNGTYSLALTTTSSANVVLSSRESGANAPRLTVEHNDTTAPQTTLTSGPSGTVASTSASFAFSASESGSTFQCSLDSTTAYTACSSPKDYSGLAPGSHTFRVRAIDAAGNVDATPASRTWTVQDTTPPDTTIASGPTGTVASSSASFTFTSSEAGSTFQCSLDSGAYSTCSSPRTYSSLANGAHTLRVRAVDAAGNVDATPASLTWTVDTAAPDTSIGSGPSGTVASTSASFAFSTSESGSTFQCSLDSTTAYTACSSPKDYSGLAPGSHTFRVRAIDAAGNVDATPASRTWTIEAADSTPPDTTIATGPSGTYRSGSADFGFSASEPGAGFECRLDGGAFTACGSAATFHVPNGRHTLEVRAVDTEGNADPTPASRSWWADGLLQNGNFETSLTGWSDQGGGYAVAGWKSSLGTLSLVGGGTAGPQAGRVTATAAGGLSMNASPWPINSTAAGTTYTVRGSTRSDTPGKTVCLRVREWDAGAVIGSAQQCLAITVAWREFAPLQYTALRGGSELELYAYQTATAVAGDSFELDGLSLGDGSPAAVPATPEASGDPVLLAAGDVASCWSSGDESVSRLLDTLPGTIAIPGDTEQNHGYAAEFEGCYDPSWGRHKARTKPAVGDHEYSLAGALGYFDYFGSAAGERGKGWYSYNLGAWHIVVLNSNCDAVGGCGPGSEQHQWLQQDLQANAGSCVGAYFHHPRFSAGGVHGNRTNGQPFWELLYQHGAEWVLGGNDHNYQRFAPQTPDGTLDRARGIRQFVVGVGGTMHYALGSPLPNTEVQNSGAFGVLKLTLHGSSYDWRFLAQDGKAFTDSGSTDCSPSSAAEPPDTTIDSGPSGTVQAPDASFAFSASRSGTTFECSIDGGAFTGCSTPKSYSGLGAGEHTFRVRAVDSAAGEDPTPASRTWTIAEPPPSQPNLIANGSFETSLSGWYGYKAGLSLVDGGAQGSKAARVSLNAAATSFSVSTSPHPVSSPAIGARYEARAWIRSQVPGRTTCLRVREWQTGAVIGTAQVCRPATGAWEQFAPIAYTAAGGDSIEVYAYQLNSVTGDSFDLDGVTLTAVP